MRRSVLLLLLVLAGVACIDFRDGLRCASEGDCDGYYCVNAICRQTAGNSGNGGGAAGGGGGSAGGSGNSSPITLATGQTGARGLLADNTNLYWLSGTYLTLSVNATPRAGGAIRALGTVTSHQRSDSRLAVDATYLYCSSSNAVTAFPLAGGNPVILATPADPSIQEFTDTLATDGTNLYWFTYEDRMPSNLLFVPKTGGAPTMLASGLDSPRSLGFAGGRVFWATGSGVMVMPEGGGAIVTVADDSATSLRSDGTNLYWLSGWNIKEMPLRGSAANTMLSSDGPIGSLAVGISDLYWVNYEGVLVKRPLAGGQTSVVSSSAGSVVTDSASVYWTESGWIMELPQ
jgi:hypothetical protein